MSAYIVFIREQITDTEELLTYAKLVRETFVAHPVKILAERGERIVLEGPAIEGAVILEFPSTEAALAWYHSPAYQAAAIHRFKGANTLAFVIEGVHPAQ